MIALVTFWTYNEKACMRMHFPCYTLCCHSVPSFSFALCCCPSALHSWTLYGGPWYWAMSDRFRPTVEMRWESALSGGEFPHCGHADCLFSVSLQLQEADGIHSIKPPERERESVLDSGLVVLHETTSPGEEASQYFPLLSTSSYNYVPQILFPVV